MMTFNLWNPYMVAPRVLEFDVTQAETATLKSGTIEFVEACLLALGVKAQLTRWHVLPYRSNFYSDYPDDEMWKDRWPIGWLLRVEVDRDLDSVDASPFGVPTPVDVFDMTSEFDYEDPGHQRTALLAAEFTISHRDPEMVESKITDLVSDGLGEAPRSEVAIRRLTNGRWQLRIIFYDIEFPTCVPILDGTLNYIKGEGGAITWRHVEHNAQAPPNLFDNEIKLGQSIPTEEELRAILQSQHPGVIRPDSGAARLARAFDSLDSEAKQVEFAAVIAGLLTDENVKVRTGAIEFFQLRPGVSEGGALVRAFESHSPLFMNVEADPPSLSGDLQSHLARALGQRAEVGDITARETLRQESLHPGGALATITALLITDRDWLLKNAREVILATPQIAHMVIREMVLQKQDLHHLLLSIRGQVPDEMLEEAVKDANPPELEEYLSTIKHS